MNHQPIATKLPDNLFAPQVRAIGEINEDLARTFLTDLADARQDDGDIAIEITTPGGDAEFARRLVLDIEDARRQLAPRRLLFLGKTQVHSAGVTLMSGFPRADRFLSRDAILLIHCRQLETSLEIAGPMRASLPQVDALKEQIELGLKLEEQNFRRLIEGSDIGYEELAERALAGWYMPAEEALDRRLVAALL